MERLGQRGVVRPLALARQRALRLAERQQELLAVARLVAGGVAALADADAGQLAGPRAGRLAVDRACDIAAKQGVGVVGVTGSNFFGAGAYYAELAARRGMISLVLSNSFPKVAAPGGLNAVLGTNPFTFGAPRRDGRSILVDMSTAAVAGSTVREKAAKGEMFEPGVAIDAAGEPILDPNKVMAGTLLPAAGGKGFGLAILVEILSAVLTGAGISRELGSMYKHVDAGGKNGHFILALDAARWSPRTETDMMRYCYHVAGAVGIMMARIMGVHPDDGETLDRACDLGLAFQIANIARDIVEDNDAGRCYLPQTWLDEMRSNRQWRISLFKQLLEGLDDPNFLEGGRTLLDNSLMLWTSEFSTPALHCSAGIPLLMAGSAGDYFRTGRHLNFNTGNMGNFEYQTNESTHNLFTSILQAFGGTDTHFGSNHAAHQGPMPNLT